MRLLRGTLASVVNSGLCDLASCIPLLPPLCPEPHRPSFCSLNMLHVLVSEACVLAVFCLEHSSRTLCLTLYCYLGLSVAFSGHTTYRNLSYHSVLFYFYGVSSL